MAKRHTIIKTTKESKALKELRERRGISLQKLADKIGISKTRVTQMEIGRANITNDYVEIFLDALEFGWIDWEVKIGVSDELDNLRRSAHDLIDGMTVGELELFLQQFVK